MNRLFLPLVALAGPTVAATVATAEELVTFRERTLTETYFSEGASAGDIDNDGAVDLVHGPFWFAGPDFATRREIYPPKPQPRERYADNFFTWIHDVDRDGWNDVLVVGLPGTSAFVFENPSGENLDRHWTKHEVFDSVGNEAPHFTHLVGDDRPQLVCTRKGVFGFITINEETPFANWAFHPISPRLGVSHFGHGLGVGDVNGDGLRDVIHAGGWYAQPPSDPASGAPWPHHPAKFTNSYGGAEMFACDVDGDGDNDIVTSLAAHDFGLAWYEQVRDGETIAFREHLIMGARPEQNRYGVVFSELHSVALADMDGDGLEDIVTGKTYYSHHEKSPQWDAGAVVFWFQLVRTPERVDWVPRKAAADAGIGRQIGIFDVNQDRLPDIVVGGMKGARVLFQERETVDAKRWREALPEVYEGTAAARADRGKPETFGGDGRVAGAIEGESMKVTRATAGKAGIQEMEKFKTDQWSGGKQLFWSNAVPRARLELEFNVAESGAYDIEGSFTVARDYAIINVLIDGRACGDPLDLYDPAVMTTGTLDLGRRSLEAGPHTLTLETIGINDGAVKKHMVGLDYIRLVVAREPGKAAEPSARTAEEIKGAGNRP